MKPSGSLPDHHSPVRPPAGWTMLLAAAMVLLLPAMRASAAGRDLATVLLEVERKAPDLRAATAETAVEKANVKVAKSRYFGELDALAKNSNYDDSRLINPIGYPVDLGPDLFDRNQFGYGVQATLPLDINGLIGARLEAARHLKQAADAGRGDVRLRLLHTAAAYYHGIEGTVADEAALEKQIHALQADIRTTEAAIEAQRAIPVKKMRLVTELEDVRGRLARLRGREQQLRAALAALMAARDFTDPVAPIHILPDQPDWNEKLIEERPDIAALKARLDAAKADERAARADRLPHMAVNGSWLRNQGYSGDGDDTWAVSVRLGLPLWDGGGRRAKVEKSDAGIQVLEQRLAALRYRARSELVAARADWDAARARYRAAVASEKAAVETARIQTNRYQEGLISADDLVNSEAALAQARSARAVALTDWWRAGDRIRLALGKEPALYPVKAVRTARRQDSGGNSRK